VRAIARSSLVAGLFVQFFADCFQLTLEFVMVDVKAHWAVVGLCVLASRKYQTLAQVIEEFLNLRIMLAFIERAEAEVKLLGGVPAIGRILPIVSKGQNCFTQAGDV